MRLGPHLVRPGAPLPRAPPRAAGAAPTLAAAAAPPRRSYLYRNVSSSAFSWDFLRSKLAQYCAEPKGLQVQLVHAAMGGGVPRECVIIWDDSVSNRQSTVERGMQFQLVKSAGVGVTWQEYKAGIAQLRARGCGC